MVSNGVDNCEPGGELAALSRNISMWISLGMPSRSQLKGQAAAVPNTIQFTVAPL